MLRWTIFLLALLASCVTSDGRREQGPDFLMVPSSPVKAVVLALHGIDGSPEVFRNAARMWAANGIATRAVRIDFGTCQPAEVVALLRANQAEFPTAIQVVVGESLGASMAIAALSELDARPPEGLVLLGPAVWPEPVSAGVLTASLSFLADLTGSDTIGRWARILNIMDIARARAGSLPAISTLVLSGENDQTVPRLGVEQLVRRISDEEYEVVAGGGHELISGAGAPRVQTEISEWILKLVVEPAMAQKG